MEKNSKGLHNVLAQMDVQYQGLFRWLAGQYDASTGGFYYARSSIHDHCFNPDIESPSQKLKSKVLSQDLFQLRTS